MNLVELTEYLVKNIVKDPTNVEVTKNDEGTIEVLVAEEDLGAVIGIGRNAVSEIECGRKTTTTEKLSKICKHYHVSADYLLGLSDDTRGGCERWTEDEERM